MIYKATGNLRAIQILLGHSKTEKTVRYLGVDIEDSLELAERTEIKVRSFATEDIGSCGSSVRSGLTSFGPALRKSFPLRAFTPAIRAAITSCRMQTFCCLGIHETIERNQGRSPVLNPVR